MTTNGILLGQCAEALRAAGIQRLNVSLDTLDPQRFRQISGCDGLEQVLSGIEAACRAGFRQIKLNVVAIRGRTEPDVVPLAHFALHRGLELRFIEFMPLDGGDRWTADMVLPAGETLRLLAEGIGPLEPVVEPDSHAPATHYRFVEGGGRIGLIRTVSRPFCGRCGRLRLTAEGKLRNCLFSREAWDVRALLRSARQRPGTGRVDPHRRGRQEGVPGDRRRRTGPHRPLDVSNRRLKEERRVESEASGE